MAKLVNKRELSEILGKSQQTLTTWQKNGLPIKSNSDKGRENLYDTSDVINWLIQREINARIQDHGSEENFFDYEFERGRLTHHQANKVSLEEQVLEGRLIESSTVENVWCDLISNFRARVLAVPTKAAHKFLSVSDLNEAQDILKEHLFEALAELAEYDPKQYGIETGKKGSKNSRAAA